MEWNGMEVCARASVCARARVYTRGRRDVVYQSVSARSRAHGCCTRRAPYRAHRAGCMGLGGGAVGQRRSTLVRLFFRCVCTTYAKYDRAE